jgi:hypothetical protein
MEKIFMIGCILTGLMWVLYCFIKGRKQALDREKICTETITAQVLEFKKHLFFFLKYYNLRLQYEYQEKIYNIKKGWFTKWNDKKEIPLHINPTNPTECYLTTLKEKCRKVID